MPDNISNTQFSSELKSEPTERIEPPVEMKDTETKKVDQVLNSPKIEKNITTPDGKIEERIGLGSQAENNTSAKLSEESMSIVEAGRIEDLEKFAENDSNYPKIEAGM